MPASAPTAYASAASDADAPGETRITVSRTLHGWLARHGCSLAFTSYQSGKLFLVGRLPDGRISLHQQAHTRAMGLSTQSQRIYLATLFQIWRLENTLGPGERANSDFDRLFVPRNAQTIGDLDVHELAIDRSGRIIFVNTKYSCLAALSPTHSFKPLWRPPFITRLAAEDRCHLNGLAMAGGDPAYVTAVSRSDQVGGWRDRRYEGGVLIDVRSDRIVTDRLSMPHSPRVLDDGRVLLLDSGRGWLTAVDPRTGVQDDIAFCPGFLRGLALHDGHAVVTTSLPRRHGAFGDLELDGAIARRDGEPWCGVHIVDLRTGDIVEWIRLSGAIQELFDVGVIPGAACPMSLAPDSPDLQTLVSIDPSPGSFSPS